MNRYTPFVPIKFGIKAFYDVGQVAVDAKGESVTHSGYGLGVFLVSLNESLSLPIAVGFSDKNSFFPVIRFEKVL